MDILQYLSYFRPSPEQPPSQPTSRQISLPRPYIRMDQLAPPSSPPSSPGPAPPRIIITYCPRCRWLLRAAYYAQELLSTFDDGSIGEVALVPDVRTGGVFRVQATTARRVADDGAEVTATEVLWDRARDGGFPETKVLKQRVRDVVAPRRDLGHSEGGGEGKKTGEGERGEKDGGGGER